MKLGAQLKWGIIIKWDWLRFGEAFSKRVAEEVLDETFFNGYKNLIQIPK
jgi:hypothetical protein